MTWLPFDLHPEYPPEGMPRSVLEEKYGRGFHDRVAAMIHGAGLPHSPPAVSPRSRPALELAEVARDEGAFEAVHDRLFRAHWAEGADLGDTEVLLGVGVGAGVDTAKVGEALASGSMRGRVDDATELAHRIGVNGVPAWLIDRGVLIMGAQPHEVFEEALGQLGYAPIDEEEGEEGEGVVGPR